MTDFTRWPGHEGEGAALLDDVHAFLGRFVAYPSEHAHVAHTLWIAHAHLMDAWDSTPRIAFLSPEPGSGKTRALEVSELLVPRSGRGRERDAGLPVPQGRATQEGPPTILYDEIDTVFGPKAKDNEEIRGRPERRASPRRGRWPLRGRGKMVETEELPAYCAVALAGLGDLPDTLLTPLGRRADAAARAGRDTSSRSAAATQLDDGQRCATGWPAGPTPTGTVL